MGEVRASAWHFLVGIEAEGRVKQREPEILSGAEAQTRLHTMVPSVCAAIGSNPCLTHRR